jgi:hypothetical protein
MAFAVLAFAPDLPEAAPENPGASSAGYDLVATGVQVCNLQGICAADSADSAWFGFFDSLH